MNAQPEEPSFMKAKARPKLTPPKPKPLKPPTALTIVTAVYIVALIIAFWAQVQFCFGLGSTISNCPYSASSFGEVIGRCLLALLFAIYTIFGYLTGSYTNPLGPTPEDPFSDFSSFDFLLLLSAIIFLAAVPITLIIITIKKYFQYTRQQRKQQQAPDSSPADQQSQASPNLKEE